MRKTQVYNIEPWLAKAIVCYIIQLGPVSGLIVVTIYGSVNLIMGNVIEPKIMGKRLGLSTLTVFLSLVFWGWLFGPVGMLLSVPLTMTVKFAAMSNPQTIWFGVLLSPVPEQPIAIQTSHSDMYSTNQVEENIILKQKLDELRRELEMLRIKQSHFPEKSNISKNNE